MRARSSMRSQCEPRSRSRLGKMEINRFSSIELERPSSIAVSDSPTWWTPGRPRILASVPHPHQHAAKRPVLDQVANRVRRIGEWKHFGDGWLDRTFGQIADESLLRGGQRLRCKGPKSEAAYLGRLPDDVGEVDVCLAAAGVANHRIRPPGKQATKRLARELSAHAIDNDVHALAAGEPHHAVSQALAREVDDVLVAASVRLLRFRASAGGGNRERCAELASNLHTLHTHRAAY